MARPISVILFLLTVLGGVCRTNAQPVDCTSAKIDEIKEEATTKDSSVVVNCHLRLEGQEVVTKALLLGSSARGVTIDCNGAVLDGGEGRINHRRDMIQIFSEKVGDRWERPESVTIRECNVIGSIRIWGMGKNGQAEEVRKSSRSLRHTERARAAAPRRIVLDKMTITGVGRNPVYFAPGVTESELTNSEVKGKSDAVAIYLDAESAHNEISNSYIHVATKNYRFKDERPQIAIDGSSHNKIFNNRFSALNHGGIYLYRNCGEGGTIRHATPSHNKILNNVFFYDKFKCGLFCSDPAVYLGSHNRGWFYRTFGFCDDDKGEDFGSSSSDKDFARHNVVMQNQFFKNEVFYMIKTKNPGLNSPNYIDHNETVSESTVIEGRPAGCFLPNKQFVFDGQFFDDIEVGAATCVRRYRCDDCKLVERGDPTCGGISEVPFTCQVTEDNKGCQGTSTCSPGQSIVGARAACNLEFGSVSEADVAALPTNTLEVLHESDKLSDGSCFVGDTVIRSGSAPIVGIVGASSVAIGCDEHDKNGGDCHIRGGIYCRPDDPEEEEVPFSCQVTGNNAGCQAISTCPLGESITGARAACNLEFGSVSEAHVSATAKDTLRVLAESDRRSDGSCFVGDTVIQAGSAPIEGVAGASSVAIGCDEHDKNGGDCHIRGAIYCRLDDGKDASPGASPQCAVNVEEQLTGASTLLH